MIQSMDRAAFELSQETHIEVQRDAATLTDTKLHRKLNINNSITIAVAGKVASYPWQTPDYYIINM